MPNYLSLESGPSTGKIQTCLCLLLHWNTEFIAVTSHKIWMEIFSVNWCLNSTATCFQSSLLCIPLQRVYHKDCSSPLSTVCNAALIGQHVAFHRKRKFISLAPVETKTKSMEINKSFGRNIEETYTSCVQISDPHKCIFYDMIELNDFEEWPTFLFQDLPKGCYPLCS